MSDPSALFLAKAKRLLGEAEVMIRVGLSDAAARTAYLAAFHAAQALIYTRTGKVAKTHRGVQAEFLRLTQGEADMDPNLRAFPSRSYNLKAVADYETGPGSEIPIERARDAVERAHEFEAWVSARVPIAR